MATGRVMTEDLASMDRLRADLIRRARMERYGEVDQHSMDSDVAHRPLPVLQETFPETPRRGPSMSRFFRRQSTRGDSAESPKTPDFLPPPTSASTTQPYFPNFSRTTLGSYRPQSRSQATDIDRISMAPSRTRQSMLSRPPASAASNQTRTYPQVRRERFTGTDPAELQLASLADAGRQRNRLTRSRPSSEGNGKKRFMFCFPWIKSRRIRSQILRCFVSGSFLIILLTVYLALLMTKNINSSEMTIMLILVIIFGTVFFCHGLIRLVILVVRGDREQARRSRMPHMSGYAVPSRPIPVVLARDEEAAGVESEATQAKPPAYGLWRESVRVDPNRLFWQRTSVTEPVPTRPDARSGPRPPSYVSEDGVSYVVEAVPRSTAPTIDVPLPPHPSEVGRAARMPAY